MSSPFEFFRQNQKVMMVWLTILAMFSFVVLGTIADQGNNETMLKYFPMAMGLLLGGIVLGLATRGSQYQWPAAILGAVLGTFVGSFFSDDAKAGEAIVIMKGGDLTGQDVQGMITRRTIANTFIQQAFMQSNPQMMQMASNPMFQGFIMQMIRSSSFGFGLETIEKDVVFGEVLRKEARDAGMIVSNELVTDYINQVTRQSLSSKDFAEILRGLRVTDLQLYDILREELMARQALMIFRPKADPTPEQMWSSYTKTELRESLDVIPIAVSSFVDKVKAPGEAELKKFFEEHKTVYPNEKAEGSIGFKQPDRAFVAYLEADYSTFEKLAGEVTDEEVTAYYEANKAKYKNEVFPEELKIDEMTFPSLDDATSPLNSNTLSQPMTSGVLSEPLTSSDVLSAPAASGVVPTTPAAVTEPVAVPATPPVTEPAPATETKPEGQSQSSVGQPSTMIQLVSFQEEQAAPAATTEKPAASPEQTPPATEAPKTETTPAPAATTEQTPVAPVIPAAPPMPEGPGAPADSDQPVEKMPEYRPLDDELKADIKSQLLRERTLAKMQVAASAARGVLSDLAGTQLLSEGNPDRLTPEQIMKKVKEYAAKNNLRFAETGWVSFQELSTSEDHPIGQAIQPIDNPLARYEAETVPEMVFSSDEQFFQPYDAVDPDSQNRFLLWKTAYKKTHVPAFTDAGIKELVTKTWKSFEARKLAEKRAEEIVKLISEKKDQPLTEVIAGQTEDGTDKTPQLVVTGTGSFSWYSRSTAAPTDLMGSQQPLTRTNLPEITGGAGEDFMKVVFEKINAGEAGVAPNRDKSIYYVTKVVFRDVDSSIRENLLGSKSVLFGGAGGGGGTPTRELMSYDQQQANADWKDLLLKKYDVQFVEPALESDPDA
jgi:hypothetical protein